MKKWNEINAETMRGILYSFINFEDWTRNKVIEVQCPLYIMNGSTNDRFYFCNGMDWMKFCEDKRLEEPFLESMKTVMSIGLNPEALKFRKKENWILPDEAIYYISLTDSNPTIIPILFHDPSEIVPPLVNTPFVDDLFRNNRKGSPVLTDTNDVKWYLKEGDERLVDTRPRAYASYKSSEKFYRIRSMDYEEWDKVIMDFLNSGNLVGCEDDLKESDFREK